MNAADFRPPHWLRNAHVQSVLSSSGLRRRFSRHGGPGSQLPSTECVFDCGEGVRLQGFHSAPASAAAAGLVVLLHGWEGSAGSGYMVNTATRLLAEGYEVVRLNFRDHGDTHALNPGLFHSCRIDEVVGAMRAIAGRFPARPLAVAGFSLGGNFALRVALRAPDSRIPLRHALAVCPVVSPGAGLFALENAPWFYQRYFLHKWRASLRRKQALFPDRELFTAAELRGNLRELTRSLVLRHTGFGSLENYLDGYSIAGSRLANLRVRATILTAADDPVIPVADFRALELPPCVELDIAKHGGHCGFLHDASLRSWAEDYLVARLARYAT
jgi:predicted alpha/beta-fold hydrolase